MRTFKTYTYVNQRDFMPILRLEVKKDDILFAQDIELATVPYVNGTENFSDLKLQLLNSMLEEKGEPHLTDEEIVLHKLTR